MKRIFIEPDSSAEFKEGAGQGGINGFSFAVVYFNYTALSASASDA